MVVTINGSQKTLKDGATVMEAILAIGVHPARAAIWVGDEHIWQRDYATRVLRADDKVTIVVPLAGG